MSKCPKCGHDNPQNTIFCEECDWRLDQPASKVKRERTGKDALIVSAVALIFGAVATLSYFMGIPAASIAGGIVGMVAGGYSINLPRYIECNKIPCMAMSALGIVLGIVGFIFGLASL